MSVVRVGATKQYSDNWDTIFSGRRASATSTSARPTNNTAKKKSAKAKGKPKSAKKSRKRK